MKITAKVHCSSRQKLPTNGADESTVWFTADYSAPDGTRRNEEWAKATPLFSCQMTVLDSVPFEAGKPYTLTFDDGE